MISWERSLKLQLLILWCVVIFIIFITHTLLDRREVFEYVSSDETGVGKYYQYNEDDLNGPGIAMDDPRLIKKLFKKYLIPPVDSRLHSYRLSKPDLVDPSMGQSERIKAILNNKRNGVFLEVGALDGETRSNTLYFERFMNWTGLLIEADPINFAEMVRKNRKAWLSPTCIGVKPHPEVALFEQNNNEGKLASQSRSSSNHVVKVQCFPLYTYLLALNMTYIDYLSVDVEGAELNVLKTVPFDKLNIQTLSVEFQHVPSGKESLSQYMLSQGYVVDSEVTNPQWLANDFIFKKM